ncbi:MAG: sensor histidine kinase [Prevotella sp.]|nr:sensor histidine kinase [Prevotella sp.]
MKKITKKDWLLFLAQAGVWVLMMLVLPLATFISTRNWETTSTSLLMVWQQLRAPLVVYFANFYLFGPYLFFRRRYWLFVICNLLLIVGMNYGFIYGYFMIREHVPAMHGRAWVGFFSGAFMFLLLNIIMVAVAIGIRHFMRIRQIRQQLKDEKAKNTEAELAWLKNQINPHFLFNTLNNISSLTQIDADAAQDAIAQLSDLLRYAMYETNKKTVPIQGEVEFMRNYIELMKLRCNNMTTVNAQFIMHNAQLEIAPLLFISLIENAFKHGVSSNRPSTIDISLRQDDDQLVFCCDNTNYPKDDADRSGSGIGLENTRRRLELMYHDHYQWEQSLDDNIYHIKITLNPTQ